MTDQAREEGDGEAGFKFEHCLAVHLKPAWIKKLTNVCYMLILNTEICLTDKLMCPNKA